MPSKIKVIVNPISGSGRALKLVKTLTTSLQMIGLEPQIYQTTRPNDAYAEAKASQDFPLIVCVGGDGTFNELINGLLEIKQPHLPVVAILPTGSGNVIAKELKLSRNTKRLVELIQNKQVVKLDVGKLSFTETQDKPTRKRKFISMAGCGFDAEVARRYHLLRKGNYKLQAHLLGYLPLALSTIACCQMPRISIEADGHHVTHQATFIQIANVRSYGGPFVLANQAKPNDGLLDILWFTGRSSRDIIRYFWHGLLNNTDKCFDVHQCRAKRITLSSQANIPIQVDGDCCGYLPVTIEIIPEAISAISSITI